MKKILIAVGVVVVSGCAANPAPNYWEGKYYMAGDPECARHYGTDVYDRMICADKDGNKTGVLRSPISEMQAQAYYQQKQSYSSSGSGVSDTVNCTKIGELINQEIKTFKGIICPVGWLPTY